MEFFPVITRPFLPPKDDIYDLFDGFLPTLREGDVLLITSKILSIHQGRCVKIGEGINKDDLIMQEAEQYIPREEIPGRYVVLTVKGHTLIPSAGIDESNANGHYILWPREIQRATKEIWKYLCEKFKIRRFAVIITDSHTTPFRYGVTGISIGFFGMEPLKDYRGKKDIFGRTLQITRVNVVDALVAAGTLLMGEGDERTPLLIIRGADFIEFSDKDTYHALIIPAEQDIYGPMLNVFRAKEKDP